MNRARCPVHVLPAPQDPEARKAAKPDDRKSLVRALLEYAMPYGRSGLRFRPFDGRHQSVRT